MARLIAHGSTISLVGLLALCAPVAKAQVDHFPSHLAVIVRLGVPEGWELEEPNRPNSVSRKLKSTDPFYLSLTIGHPSDSLYGIACYKDHPSVAKVLEAYGTERIAGRYKARNADERAEMDTVAVTVDTLGGVPSLHIRTLTVMHGTGIGFVTHAHHIRVREGWLYLAYAYEPEDEAVALPKVQAALARLRLGR